MTNINDKKKRKGKETDRNNHHWHIKLVYLYFEREVVEKNVSVFILSSAKQAKVTYRKMEELGAYCTSKFYVFQ